MDLAIKLATVISAVLGALTLLAERLSKARREYNKELRLLQIAKMRYEIEEILERTQGKLDRRRYDAIRRHTFGELDLDEQVGRDLERSRFGITALDAIFGFAPGIIAASAILLLEEGSDLWISPILMATQALLMFLVIKFGTSRIRPRVVRAIIDLICGIVSMILAVFVGIVVVQIWSGR